MSQNTTKPIRLSATKYIYSTYPSLAYKGGAEYRRNVLFPLHSPIYFSIVLSLCIVCTVFIQHSIQYSF